MTYDMKIFMKKVLTIFLGIIVAFVFSTPYLFFRDEIQKMALLGYVGVFIACAISNASVLLPSSSTVIVLSAASVLNPILCVIVGGLGAAAGEQVSYILGRVGRKVLGDVTNDEKTKYVVTHIKEWMDKNDILTVLIFAFLPLPIFDIVGIAAGALKMNWVKYTIAAATGKILKFSLSYMGANMLFNSFAFILDF